MLTLLLPQVGPQVRVSSPHQAPGGLQIVDVCRTCLTGPAAMTLFDGATHGPDTSRAPVTLQPMVMAAHAQEVTTVLLMEMSTVPPITPNTLHAPWHHALNLPVNRRIMSVITLSKYLVSIIDMKNVRS